MDKTGALQKKSRKARLNRASKLKGVTVEPMADRGCETEVKCNFDKFKSV